MSNPTHAAITSVASYIPEGVLTNKDLVKMVDTTEEWIDSRTGIKERRILKDGSVSDMGACILKDLCKKRDIPIEEIDMVICATITGDTLMPDTANTICYKAGATKAFGFDLNAACSGFLFALTTGAQFIEAGTYKKVVILGIDKMSSIIDYTDRTTCIIFGDGGGGVLLEPNNEGLGVQKSILKGDGNGRQFLNIKAGGSDFPTSTITLSEGGHYFFQDGRPVFKHAVTNMSNVVKELLEVSSLSVNDVNWVIPHQANIRIINAVANAIDFPIEKVVINIQKYGNTTAGTLPLCIWEKAPDFKKGDNIVLTAFGAGFTWGAVHLTWAI